MDRAAQQLLLGAVDTVPRLVLAQRGGSLITKGCLSQALRSAPKGRVPGSDGITYDALQAFWGVLAEPLVQCLNQALLP